MDQKEKIIFGSFEYATFPEWRNVVTLTKIDTGAYTGALHCTYIERMTNEQGKDVLKFRPFDFQNEIFETEKFKSKSVRSSNGQQDERFVIDTSITIKGKTYDMRIGLTDRSVMQYEVLIGRRFLRKNKILVDVARNQNYDNDSGDII